MKKVLILLPDGVGIRNFATSHFSAIATSSDIEVVWWNGTASELDVTERQIALPKPGTHWFTGILKNARKRVELNSFIRKFGDEIYNLYYFPPSFAGWKNKIKSYLTQYLIRKNNSAAGLEKICASIQRYERKTDYYRNCLKVLEHEKPDLVFCTNQRHMTAIAPLLAAQDLEIPTASFIFSWDNLPKATMVVTSDYYMVWSDFMKDQMNQYYPEIQQEKILVVGTPQFEPHFQKDLLLSRADFFAQHGMDPQKEYICFSGDDITTSPDDPEYLRDLAKAVSALNASGENLGIVFRCCPVDFSNRYDAVQEEYQNIIVQIRPAWKREGNNWQSVIPTVQDNALLANTVAHTKAVFNLGSSMVFDFVSQEKPCAYFNYNQPDRIDPSWDLHQCYTYVHFRSMPSKQSVIWVDSPHELANTITTLLNNPGPTVQHAMDWFEKITMMPASSASERIFKAMQHIMIRE